MNSMCQCVCVGRKKNRRLERIELDVFTFQLLTVNPEHRFCSLAHMQTAPYLSDVNWDAVYEKKMEAGFVPNVGAD